MIALFPGQGAQKVGMGQALVENFSVARRTFEEASDHTGVDIGRLCFEGPEADLMLTENTQPCLLTVSVAAFRVAEEELGFEPKLVMGHSLGEYSALVAAGALELGTAARWVKERGRAMQAAVPAGTGTMAAILNLDDAQVREICAAAQADVGDAEVVEPANFNAPGQVVIAGSVAGVERAGEIALADKEKYRRAKVVPLQVSAPFHCRMMKPARERMAELFANATEAEKAKTLRCGYFPNRTAELTETHDSVFKLLVEQVDHPVLWSTSMTAAMKLGHTQGVEFGVGNVLAGLAKRIAKKAEAQFETFAMDRPEALKEIQ